MIRSAIAVAVLVISTLVAAPAAFAADGTSGGIIADEGGGTKPAPLLGEPELPPGVYVGEEEIEPGVLPLYQNVKDASTNWTTVRKWYGVQIRFYRGETQLIGMGVTACANFLALKTGPAGPLLVLSCSTLSLAADFALMYGNCLAVNVSYGPGWVNPWYWHC